MDTTTAATARTEITEGAVVSPHDTTASSATRFALELVAWSAGPLAVHQVTGSPVLTGLALAGLVLTPALFNTPGDKHQEGPIDTPGPVRLAIELGLWTVAVAGSAIVWSAPVAAGVAVLTAAATVAGAPRARWLLAGAPLPTP